MNNLFMAAFAVALFACSTGQCFAVLGETEAEIVKRYGEPDQVALPPDVHPPAEKILAFLEPGVTITVYMWRGRSASEMYFFEDARGEKSPVAQNLEKAKTLFLDANAAGGKWVAQRPEVMRPDMVFWWDRSDGKATASVPKASPDLLSVTDAAFLRESQTR